MLALTVRSGLVAVLGAVLVACSPAAVASLLPAADGPLVTVTTRGGECFDGPCGSTIIIERDGRVHQTAPVAAESGTVPAQLLTALDASVKATDFDLIRARPFTGECPVNFDGQEVIYEIESPGGVERIASCETEIDPDHPVFAGVEAALAAVQATGP